MIKISFSPANSPATLTLEKNGNCISINGELFNFNALNDGDVIRAEDVPHEFIVGDVRMEAGVLHLTILLPYKVSRFGVETPEPITVTGDGPVVLPNLDPEPEETEEPADVDA